MQQAIRNPSTRRPRSGLDACKKQIRLIGAVVGELVALASMTTALAAGLLLLTTLFAGW